MHTPGARRRDGASVVSAVLVALLLCSVVVGCSDGSSAPDASPSAGGGPRATVTPQDAVARSQLSQLPAFRDVPWADDLKAEQDRFDSTEKASESPYGGFSTPDFAGRYTNVSNSERRTLPSACDCPERTVWFFGASSAFGLGQRDDYTTASHLVREGDADGVHLNVRNLAAPGHTFIEEVEGLEAHLRIDKVQPDLVVFFDGFNDALASYMYARVRDGALLDPIRFRGPWVDEFLKDPSSASGLSASEVDKVAGHAAGRYQKAQERVRKLLAARGIPSIFFLQPDGFVSPLQAKGLAKSLNLTMSYIAGDSDFSRLLRKFAVDLGGDVVDLRAAVAKFDEPIFADTTHFNETGAAFLAAKMYPVVDKALQ